MFRLIVMSFAVYVWVTIVDRMVNVIPIAKTTLTVTKQRAVTVTRNLTRVVQAVAKNVPLYHARPPVHAKGAYVPLVSPVVGIAIPTKIVIPIVVRCVTLVPVGAWARIVVGYVDLRELELQMIVDV